MARYSAGSLAEWCKNNCVPYSFFRPTCRSRCQETVPRFLLHAAPLWYRARTLLQEHLRTLFNFF